MTTAAEMATFLAGWGLAVRRIRRLSNGPRIAEMISNKKLLNYTTNCWKLEWAEGF